VFIPEHEAGRIREFVEHMRDVSGKHRRLTFNGTYILENENLYLIFHDGKPFLEQTNDTVLEIRPIEVDVAKAIIMRNKKLRGEDI
jgi:hypothetical protein